MSSGGLWNISRIGLVSDSVMIVGIVSSMDSVKFV